MKKEIYEGNDSPVSFSVTALSNGYAVTICLGIKYSESESDKETIFDYTVLSGIIDDIRVETIINIIIEEGCSALVDKTFIEAISSYYNLDDSDILGIVKKIKLQAITDYDSSAAVNCFYLSETAMWIPRDTRISLMNSTTIEKSVGKSVTTLWYDTRPFDIPCDSMIQMLQALEIYALTSYNVTASHKANVIGLTDVDAIIEYDYTKGYPDILEFAI